jgi:hypothetical protein
VRDGNICRIFSRNSLCDMSSGAFFWILPKVESSLVELYKQPGT